MTRMNTLARSFGTISVVVVEIVVVGEVVLVEVVGNELVVIDVVVVVVVDVLSWQIGFWHSTQPSGQSAPQGQESLQMPNHFPHCSLQ